LVAKRRCVVVVDVIDVKEDPAERRQIVEFRGPKHLDWLLLDEGIGPPFLAGAGS
jgi:hypothetical protein